MSKSPPRDGERAAVTTASRAELFEATKATVADMAWNVHQGRVMAMAMLGSIPKLGTHDQQRYSYGTTEQVREALRGVMAVCGLTLTSSELEAPTFSELADSKGKPVHRATVRMSYITAGPDGSVVGPVIFTGEALDYGDKALAKAYTMAWKAAVRELFCLSFTDDPDPEASSIEDASGQGGARRSTTEGAARRDTLPTDAPHWARWGSRAAYQEAVRVLWERARALPDKHKASVDMHVDRFGLNLQQLTWDQFRGLEHAIGEAEGRAQVEQRPAEPRLNPPDHHEAHQPTTEHDHRPIGFEHMTTADGRHYHSTGWPDGLPHDDRHEPTADHAHDPDDPADDIDLSMVGDAGAHVHPHAHLGAPHSP